MNTMIQFFKDLTLGRLLRAAAILFVGFVALRILVIIGFWFERRPFILLGFIIAWIIATGD